MAICPTPVSPAARPDVRAGNAEPSHEFCCDLWLIDHAGSTVLRCQCLETSPSGMRLRVPLGYGVRIGQRYELRSHLPGEGHAQHAQPSKTEPQPRQQTERATTQPAKGPQLPLCPVTGEPIDFSFKTMTADGPVYFASDEAIKKFNGDPEPYGAKVTEQRAALAKLARVQVSLAPVPAMMAH